MVPAGKNVFVLRRDGHQRIYSRKAAMSRCGIDIRGGLEVGLELPDDGRD